MQDKERFDSAANMLSAQVRRPLLGIAQAQRERATEICLRVGRPLAVMCAGHMLFVGVDGSTSQSPLPRSYIVSKVDMQDSFVSLCGWSVHSHQKELTEGYISVRGGHRAGVAATAVVEDGKMSAVRSISSINLRIAREIYGAADALLRACFLDKPCGLLLLGPPASGKTTLLRDLARQLSSGGTGCFLKVCVVDESGEIGAAANGLLENDLGPCCDLLSGYPKAQGLRTAVRYLSPQVLVCDEIYTDSEIDAVAAAANSGVAVITSMHAASLEEFYRKPQAQRLLATGAFAWIAVLEGANAPSRLRQVERVGSTCLSWSR